MLIEMEISALAIDPTMNMPFVILKNSDGTQMLPIWIGILEASAIATKLEKVELTRPMTHDLIKNMLEGLEATIEKIIISDLAENTYYARIFLKSGERELEFDARPSDSMALALRTGAKIFVDQSVIEKSRKMDAKPRGDAVTDKDKWAEILENMDPEDFGKYKM
jgi:uncharacterized protein